MEYISCNLCSADNYKTRFPSTNQTEEQLDVSAFRCTVADYGQHCQIVECKNCGYIYANPRFTADELINAYTNVEDEIYVQEQTGRILTFQKRLKDMEKITGKGSDRSLLDVGAYTGVFVDVAQKAGWNAVGIEPSGWAIGEANKIGVQLIQGTLDSPELQKMKFDVVTMWDVIEHVDNPFNELHKAYKLLKPGGFIVVHTMDINSFLARLLGPRWPWLLNMHIHYFSRRTLQSMFDKVGFETIKTTSQGRYITLGYLITRVTAFSPMLGKLIHAAVQKMNCSQFPIFMNLGDLVTSYGVKKS